MRAVKFLRSDNWLTVDPCTPNVRACLTRLLTFVEREYKKGKEKAMALKAGLTLINESPVECFVDDHKGRISFPFGFCEAAAEALSATGHSVEVVNLTPHKDPSVFEPRFDLFFESGLDFKYRQDEFVVRMLCNENGRFDCPTGYGKSFLAGAVGIILPKARIAIVSKSVTVVRDRIYPEVSQMLSNVGIVCDGKKLRGRRIMCYTADSLRWAIKDSAEYGNYDVLIFDECHLAAADACAAMLAELPGQPRMYGLSASHDMRFDCKDYRVHALFGPIRMSIPYEEAMENNIVVPMEVVVRKVVMDYNPCSGLAAEDKMKHGIWRNQVRNDMVIEDAVSYAADGQQTMISCQVLEHVLNLKKRFDKLKAEKKVPEELELVCLYRQHASHADWLDAVRLADENGVGDVLRSLPYMDDERRAKLTKDIERGKILLFAGTTILNVGFDPKDMRVVCRADCTSSKIADTQVPGRNARHGTKMVNGEKLKRKGIIRDYWDMFDAGLGQRFRSRRSSYEGHGWSVQVLSHKSALQAKLKRQ